MSSEGCTNRPRWRATARRALLLLTGAIAACGSRSGVEQLTRVDIEAPELEVAAAPEDTSPPVDAELAAPSASIGAATGCVDITRRFAGSPPTVLLLIDQSSSMRESFGESTRWDVLRQAIVDPDEGLLTWLDASAKIGLIS